jgi:hypothetical protein
MADTDPPPIWPGLPALELRLIHPEERARFDQTLCEQHFFPYWAV